MSRPQDILTVSSACLTPAWRGESQRICVYIPESTNLKLDNTTDIPESIKKREFIVLLLLLKTQTYIHIIRQ